MGALLRKRRREVKCLTRRLFQGIAPPRGILPSMRLFPLLLCLSLSALAQDEPPTPGGGGHGGPESKEPINESTFSSLKARQIGPAFVSGRISQIAVFPDDSNHRSEEHTSELQSPMY